MRLIDADAIPKDSMIRMALRQEPTVEAIPVSWIIQWAAEHMAEYGTLTIERLLEDWEKFRKGE
ncbi:MAG: hypothetical protein IJH05_03570 [Firmicutes bacterium]|nr:hypothetical protein [Bacillota bacterium]